MLVQSVGGANVRTDVPRATFLQSISCLWLAVGLTVTLQAWGVEPFAALACSGPVWLLWIYITIPVSVMAHNLAYLCVDLFFRDVAHRNTFKVPSKAPVIFVCAPHSNQLIDPLIIMRTCPRAAGFLCAAKTWRKPIIGDLAKALDSIPVERPQDLRRTGKGRCRRSGSQVLGEGTAFLSEVKPSDRLTLADGGCEYSVLRVVDDFTVEVNCPADDATRPSPSPEAEESAPLVTYSIMPHVDSHELYEAVFERLSTSECIGIFPEGGSHDRSELMPFKVGAAKMALGAVARYPGLPVCIVPVGLHYFRGHRFRGSVLVDYGEPIDVPAHLVKKYEQGGALMHAACNEFLDIIHQGINSVTISAPDYESVQLFWMLRRLHKESVREELGRRPTLEEQVALTQAFSERFGAIAERESTKELKKAVDAYNQKLRLFGLRDHQVGKRRLAGKRFVLRTLGVMVQLTINGLAAFPAILLGLPFVLSYQVGRAWAQRERLRQLKASRVKVTGRDVVATYKVLIALILTPLLHVSYTYLVWSQLSQRAAVCYFFFAPFISWCGLVRFGERYSSALGELWNVISVLLFVNERDMLIRTRDSIKEDILKLVNEVLAPEGEEAAASPSLTPSGADGAAASTQPSARSDRHDDGRSASGDGGPQAKSWWDFPKKPAQAKLVSKDSKEGKAD